MTDVKCKVHLYQDAKIEQLQDEVVAVFMCLNCKSALIESMGFISNPKGWTQSPERAKPPLPEIPAYENYLAEIRCAQLDFLAPYCSWGGGDIQTSEQIKARQLWKKVMDRQSDFENTYC